MKGNRTEKQEHPWPMNKGIAKRILFVSTQFPPNDSVGTQRIVKFVKYLKLKGWDIHVLTLEEKYYSGSSNSYQFYLPEGIHVHRRKKIEVFRWWEALKKFSSGKSNHSESANSAKTHTSKTGNNRKPQSKNPSLFFRFKELVSNLLQYPDQENGFIFSAFFSAYSLISKYKIPFVFISSPPHSPFIPLNLLRRLRKFIYVIDFRDPWARSQWQSAPQHLHQKIAKRLDLFFERQTLKLADIVIFNTDQLKKEFTHYYRNNHIPRKFYFISNGYDPEIRSRFCQSNLTNGENQEKITLLHTGTLYKKRNPEILFEALSKFRNMHPREAQRIQLKFIGILSRELQYLKNFIRENQLADQITFLPKLPYDQVLEEMKKARWLVLLQPGTTFQIPAKFYDYLLVGKPIWGVVEPNSVSEQAINRLKIGWVSYCHSVESIVEFFKMVSAKERMVITPDEEELEKYSLPYLVDSLEKILLHGRTKENRSV